MNECEKYFHMKRYNDFNTYLKSIYGCRVHKITLDAGLSCPNRDGNISVGGCIYCNDKGSGNGLSKIKSIGQQVDDSILRIAKRFKAKKFIAYFQSFSNTYAPVQQLKKLWDQALNKKDIIGLALATRPDCIHNSILDLVEKYTRKYLVWIEYGLQSAHNQTLTLINRGHDVECFTRAVQLTKKRNIKVCAHVMLGLPNETTSQMLETADFLSEIKIDAVKIHLLYVIKTTPMEKLYKEERYSCLGQSEYASLVCSFIERLSPNIVIQRLVSDPNPDELVAPLWTLQKSETLSLIDNLLKSRDSWQGKKWMG